MPKTLAVETYNINDVIEYAVCPAKSLIGRTVERKPAKALIKDRLRPAISEMIMLSMGMNGIKMERVEEMVKKIFLGLDYGNMENDLKDVTNLFVILNNLLKVYEMTISGGTVPIESSYMGMIIQSSIDFTAHDGKRGYINPIVVDFSKTKYEHMYNPIAYRCHTVAKDMEIRGTNTQVIVLNLASGTRWPFELKRYRDLLESAIGEMALTMRDDRWPVRFGWWCAGCDYKGICNRLVGDTSELYHSRRGSL